LTLQGSLSFRSTPKAIEMLCEEIPELRGERVPSFTTVQRWAATVGYFKIERAKVRADDWQVVIDLSIQMGNEKCLTILGCRQADIKPGQALTLQDLEPIEVRILDKVNGQAIREALEAARRKVGEIQAICSDEGSDVLAGIRLYQTEHVKTIHIPDIAHKMANLLKKRLKYDVTWDALCKNAAEMKRNVQQTELAAIAPPNQRSKARFMNADVLTEWATKMLCLLDYPQQIQDILDLSLVEQHLGWLRQYRQAVLHYANLAGITRLARHLVRTLGVCTAAMVEFEAQAFELELNIAECQFVGDILDFLREQSCKTSDIGNFIGSSEILESFFGKFKSMEGDQCKSGFTGLVLAAHAHVGTIDEEVVAAALSSVPTKQLQEWIKNQVGSTVQSKRRRLFTSAKGIFQNKIVQEPSGVLERKVVCF
jgi:hypothetical protein